ncbi:universal stress protein [Haloferax marisrubri]|uniref:Universal stress protein n=1 Tax=Haloferax marisrubri TaxID=1544719 RepID=A0A2P4NQ68_9EURY|nr:universal stress protein [Haloferax marisrubri]POG55292.1 universal stress protein [Haloferax marisrubri]
MYTNILVPVDTSPESMNAASHAIRLADAVGASVHALYVTRPPVDTDDDGERSQSRSERAFADVVERAEDHGVEVETTVLVGDPAETIADFAEANHADLIVMGTHGREGVDRLFNGSVAERVGRLASVPVTTIRLRDGEQSVRSALEAQRIAREKLAHTGHDDAVIESPSRQRSAWVVRAADDRGEYNVHINSASGQAKLVQVG